MRRAHTLMTVLTALFAALVCAATMFFRIPSPIGGYLNLGDGFVLLSAYILGPLPGAAAAGLGSMLADILAGYPIYAPGTLVVKALVALAGGCFYRGLSKRSKGPVAMLPAGIVGELVMAAGYFVYSALFLGYGAGALVEVPGNLCQGAAGVVLSMALTPILLRQPGIHRLLSGARQ